ncbi:sigma-54 interaction domain-containing protein [Candidatus Syntrophocurvum alkaliphilum]|uniref:sigma-54 interaction domain-containing protein n=1 Tax=Candidatus Syntrophocurvum alkaliphilum TaxID=2293317 RepID=UPI0012E284A2|nr:sigma 54-interacting transcriptional regulator [Candidatus Syntrophocurvum alkaliphilum]
MERLIHQAIRVGQVDTTVLITGESGVGKELIAEIIHNNSNRRAGTYVKLNCAAIPENLLESELFGYEAGAFTGAKKEGKIGLFQVADGGTLLLDEIGEIPLHIQVKLLRAIQEREIIRVGGTKSIKIDVRLITITNKNLEQMVKAGEFREDLFYRLNVIPINVPPLRKRKDEIPLLANYFCDKFNRKYKLNMTIKDDALKLLMEYKWPGNIRQLENFIERLIVTSATNSINSNNLPDFIHHKEEIKEINKNEPVIINKIIPLKSAVETVEKKLLIKALELTDSYNKVAELLNVNPSTISRKAQKYGILKIE